MQTLAQKAWVLPKCCIQIIILRVSNCHFDYFCSFSSTPTLLFSVVRRQCLVISLCLDMWDRMRVLQATPVSFLFSGFSFSQHTTVYSYLLLNAGTRFRFIMPRVFLKDAVNLHFHLCFAAIKLCYKYSESWRKVSICRPTTTPILSSYCKSSSKNLKTYFNWKHEGFRLKPFAY